MAGGIDTSDRKPRRLRGTPALRFVNRYSFLTLAAFSGLGYWIANLDKIERIKEDLFPAEEIARERKQKLDYIEVLQRPFERQKSSAEIRKVLRHKQKYETEL